LTPFYAVLNGTLIPANANRRTSAATLCLPNSSATALLPANSKLYNDITIFQKNI
jgi:hypothetical protein